MLTTLSSYSLENYVFLYDSFCFFIFYLIFGIQLSDMKMPLENATDSSILDYQRHYSILGMRNFTNSLISAMRYFI